ncbi:MAG: hypothetical protein SOV66_08235 [Sodaliphilus sp.]|nr:hypothetical protein [Sodaliphilus sp.]
MECFAFGGATVRFASLETSFHAANHTIPPPNAKHSTLPQGCFFMFLFLIPFTIRQQCIIYAQIFSTEPE